MRIDGTSSWSDEICVAGILASSASFSFSGVSQSARRRPPVSSELGLSAYQKMPAILLCRYQSMTVCAHCRSRPRSVPPVSPTRSGWPVACGTKPKCFDHTSGMLRGKLRSLKSSGSNSGIFS